MATKPKRLIKDAFDVLRRARMATDSVAVGMSCGKDSCVVLDLCLRWFDRVAVYYLYVVPGLSFHQQYLEFWKRRCGPKLVTGEIIQLPHWALSKWMRWGLNRPDGLDAETVPQLSIKDVEVQVAKLTGVTWFATGQKKQDSLERRAMLNVCDGIDLKTHRIYPLAEWGNRSVTQYLRAANIPLSPEYPYLGVSYGGSLEGDHLAVLKEHFPSDFEKVIARFPFAEANLARVELGMTDKKTKRQA